MIGARHCVRYTNVFNFKACNTVEFVSKIHHANSFIFNVILTYSRVMSLEEANTENVTWNNGTKFRNNNIEFKHLWMLMLVLVTRIVVTSIRF